MPTSDSKMTSLPFVPEPIELLKARYPAAVADPLDGESIQLGSTPRPGQLRRHVFDSNDGLRLIVSRELHPGIHVLHISASACEGSKVWNQILHGRLTPRQFMPMAEAFFRDISGDEEPLDFGGFSPGKGVPHWFRKL